MSTRLNINEKGEVTNFNEYLIECVNELPTEVDNDGQIIVYTGLYRWNDGSIHKEPEIPNALIEAANKLAKLYKTEDPELVIYFYPHPNEIRLLEISPINPTTGKMHPFRYGPGEIGYSSCIFSLSEKEWAMLKEGKLKLPDDWKNPIKLL